MSRASPKEGRPATRADLDALPETVVGEIIDGVLYTVPRPRPRHADIDILWQSVRRARPAAKKTGRHRMALNRSLRTAALKHIKRWSFPDTFKEVQRNLDYRAFTQFFDEKIPVASTLSRNLACIDAPAVRAPNEHLITVACPRAVVQGRSYRQDTTVCETNVHHPTDSSLLQDGVRVLQRLPAAPPNCCRPWARCATAPRPCATGCSRSPARRAGGGSNRSGAGSSPIGCCCASCGRW
jgi:hypothetical protein